MKIVFWIVLGFLLCSCNGCFSEDYEPVSPTEPEPLVKDAELRPSSLFRLGPNQKTSVTSTCGIRRLNIMYAESNGYKFTQTPAQYDKSYSDTVTCVVDRDLTMKFVPGDRSIDVFTTEEYKGFAKDVQFEVTFTNGQQKVLTIDRNYHMLN